MNFLIDANLPARIKQLFESAGHMAIHTLDLPDGNATSDTAILEYCEKSQCIIVSKDSDFSTTFWLQNRPKKLLLISTGNIRNIELESLLNANLESLLAALNQHQFVELTRQNIIIHA